MTRFLARTAMITPVAAMFRRIVLMPVIVVALCALVSSPLLAQSKSDGERLFQEALKLQEKARSKDDQQKAVQKYEEALIIFRKVGGNSRWLFGSSGEKRGAKSDRLC